MTGFKRLFRDQLISVLGKPAKFKSLIWEYENPEAIGLRIGVPDSKGEFLAIIPIQWLDYHDQYILTDPLFSEK